MENNEFERQSAELMEWLKQSGAVISPKIQLADMRSVGAGRGLIALEDIAKEKDLFFIPHSAVLSVENSDLAAKIPTDLEGLNPFLCLVLVMLYEAGRGEASQWWPYLRVLPAEFDTLVYWSESELAQLQGSRVLRKIGKDDANKEFTGKLLPLVLKHADLFGEHGVSLEMPDAKEAFLAHAHRMANIIQSYAFDIPEPEEEPDEYGLINDDEENPSPRKGMVPLADMLNADGEKCNANLFNDDLGLRMAATENITKGEEIFTSNGELPRSDLLRRYGYLTNDKRFDVVEIDASMLVEQAETFFSGEEINDRIAMGQKWEMWEPVSHDISREAGDDNLFLNGFDESLLACLKLLTLPKVECEAMLNSFQSLRETGKVAGGDLDSISMTEPMASMLCQVLKSRQKEYSTTIAEDTKLLQDATLQKRHRLAIEVRLGEKEILASVVQYLEHRKLSTETDPTPHSNGHSSKKRKTNGTSMTGQN